MYPFSFQLKIKFSSFLFILGLLMILISSCRTQNQDTKSIAEVRNFKPGTSTKISGIVTVPSGAFASSRPFGYAIQDTSGGIYIVDSTKTLSLSEGQRVEVSGQLGNDHGMITLIESAAKLLDGNGTITPLKVKTGEVKVKMGALVKTSGIIDSTHNDGAFGYKIYINDGSGSLDVYININESTKTILSDSTSWKAGDEVTVSGFASIYDGVVECDPIDAEDLQILSVVRDSIQE